MRVTCVTVQLPWRISPLIELQTFWWLYICPARVLERMKTDEANGGQGLVSGPLCAVNECKMKSDLTLSLLNAIWKTVEVTWPPHHSSKCPRWSRNQSHHAHRNSPGLAFVSESAITIYLFARFSKWLFLLTYYISVIHKSELLSQMLGFYSTLEFITSIAMVCDIWTDVWGCWTTVLWDLFCHNRKTFCSYIIIMAHIDFLFTDSCRVYSRYAFWNLYVSQAV